MKILTKYAKVLVLVMVGFGLVGQLAAVDQDLSNVLGKARNEALIEFLYQKYDENKENFARLFRWMLLLKSASNY